MDCCSRVNRAWPESFNECVNSFRTENEMNIYDEKGNLLISVLDTKKYDNVFAAANKTKNTCGYLFASLIPVRTDRGHILQDLFLPVTMNKISTGDPSKSLASRVISCAISIITDLATLPARALTLLPRMYYNSHQQTAPLKDLLGIENLERVIVEQIETTPKTSTEPSLIGGTIEVSYNETKMQRWAVNLVDTTWYPEAGKYSYVVFKGKAEDSHGDHLSSSSWTSYCEKPGMVKV